jgi:hypothetical protein
MTNYPKIRLTIRPVELKEANAFIEQLHRHHKRVQGHRFSLGVYDESGTLRGVATVGRPVSRGCNPKEVLEVTRLCTDGCYNACSKLYSAVARVAREMGYKKVQTYILSEEDGASLKAANYTLVGHVKGRSWDAPSRARTDKHPTTDKWRYEIVVNA